MKQIPGPGDTKACPGCGSLSCICKGAPECVECGDEYTLDDREPAAHGMCWQCASNHIPVLNREIQKLKDERTDLRARAEGAEAASEHWHEQKNMRHAAWIEVTKERDALLLQLDRTQKALYGVDCLCERSLLTNAVVKCSRCEAIESLTLKPKCEVKYQHNCTAENCEKTCGHDLPCPYHTEKRKCEEGEIHNYEPGKDTCYKCGAKREN